MSEIVQFVDELCGIYFRTVLLPNAGDKATQHVHDYDHATLVTSGSATFWADGVSRGTVGAGTAVVVKAGVPHWFIACVPNTRITCVHDAASAQSIKDKGL